MGAPELTKLAPGYFARWLTCQPGAIGQIGIRTPSDSAESIIDSRLVQIGKTCARIVEHQGIYEDLVNRVPNAMPWIFPALLHVMESNLDFTTHLHNGDSLKRRTVNAPAGRPVKGTAPFTWLESALDALRYDRMHLVRDWSISGILYALEAYNGWGYHYRGLPSPYLWAGCQHERLGKFIVDGLWDSRARSHQIGAAVLLHRLCVTHAVSLRGIDPKTLEGGQA